MLTSDQEIARVRLLRWLPAPWPIGAPLTLLGLALVLPIIVNFALRLDERVGRGP